MKKFKSTKKYSFFVIVTILIISMVSMLVYGIGNNNQFTISKEYEFGELEHGKTKDIKYTITPNPIKFKDNVEKDVVLVLDTSQTVDRGNSYEKISEAAQAFVTGLLNGYKNLKIGIVSYNEKAEILHRFDNSANSINSDIKKCYDNYNIDSGNHLGTNVGDAFRLAISMLGKDVNANKEKIVIFMSNGKPNAYTGKFYKGPESTISKEKISSLNRYEQRLYEITSLNGNEEELGKESLQQEENTISNKIKDYEKYFYNPEGLDEYGNQNFQKRGLRIDKVNDLIYYEYGINNAKDYINKIYRGKSTYSVNVLPIKDDGANIISYYMGSEIGYAYSLKMAKEMKDFGISTYPIYFDNDGIDNNKKNNDTRENTMKLISKFAGNEEGDSVTSVNTVYSNDITASLNDVFTNLDKNIKDSYSVNDAKLTINIPEGLEVESINYSGKTIKINKEDLNDGKYELPLDNLSYKFDKNLGTYIYDGKTLEVNITVRGINTSGSDKNCSITGDVYSKSIEDSKKTDLPKINIKVKSGIKVEITVNDFIGNVGEKYDSTYIKSENDSFNFIKEPKRLIGDGNADISVKGMPENKDEEYWIKTWFTKENSNEEINKEEFKLNNINSDIDLDKANNLTYQSYNVNHLETTGDEDSWNDRNQVFKSKQGDTGFLPANKIAGETGYGVDRIFQYGEPLKLNSKRPVYVYDDSKYCELKKTGKYKELYDNGRNIKFEVWTYKWENLFGNIENREVYKYKEKWFGPKGGKIIYVDNWMWKHKTIFYDKMTVDNINDNNKYPGFSYKEADKYWGYIKLKPKESGWYLFGTYSDDGSRFNLTIDDKTYELSKSNFGLNNDGGYWYIGQERGNFKVHETAFYSSFTPIYLDENKYYPIQLEYFNWGGEGAFKLGYCKLDNYSADIKKIFEQFNKATSKEDYESLSDIFNQEELGPWYKPYYRYYINGSYINDCLNKLKWVGDKNGDEFTMYPSKSNEPGDVANEVFEGKSGVELPKENGVYTMHYKIFTRAKDGKIGDKIIKDNIIKGIYGKFEIKDLLNAGIDVTDINGDNKIYANNNAIVNYRINPNSLNVTDVIRDGKKPPNKIILSNLKINGLIPKGLTLSNNNSVDGNLESDGSTRIHTNGMKDIVYNLKGNQYVANSIDEKVDVIVKSVGNFVFKEDQNTVGFNLKYEDKETKPMLENFKGSSVSINEPTKIEKFGILDSASSDNIKDASEGVQVVNGIPLKIAILADVKSPNSIIDLGFNSQNIKVSNEENPHFKVKIYNKGNLINCEKEFNIDKLEGSLIEGLNSGIKISGLDVGEKVIVIELIPNNIEINNSALLKTKVENSNDKEHLAKLDYAEMPDVF